jgi:WD40 repeat protein
MRRIINLLLCLTLASVSRGDDAAKPDKPILVLDAGGHTAVVYKVLFKPDGRELITVSNDKTIRVWDVATGEPLRVLRPPIGRGKEGMIDDAALSPDGRTLAVGGNGFEEFKWGEIHLIDLSTGRIVRTFQGHANKVMSIAFSPDGKRLVSGSADRTARIWDVATGECEHVLEGHTEAVYGVVFSPDGRRLATASYDTTGRIWSVETGKLEAELKGHAKEVGCVAWSPDGQVIATGSMDQTIRIWSPDGKYVRSIDGLGNSVLSLTFAADSRVLLATWGGFIKIAGTALLDVATGNERVRFAEHTDSVFSGALSPDGSLAATTGGDDNETYIWKTADASLMQRLTSKGRTVWSTGWTSDAKAIAWGNTRRFKSENDRGPIERTFRLADLELAPAHDDALVRAWPVHGAITSKHVDDTTLAIERNGATTATIRLSGKYDMVRCFTLLPNDRVAIGADRGLYLFDARSGQKVRDFMGYTRYMNAVAPSPDDRFLLSGSMDQTLRVWDPNRDEPLLSLFVAGDDWVAWTPEGYYAASPGGEKLMGWHVNNGRDQMASFYPAAQFRKSLYRPDVIKLILTTGSTERALEVADQARGKATVQTEVAKVLPPSVEIAVPRHGATVDSPKLEVKAIARSRGDQPVTALRLLLDGRPYRGQAGVKAIDEPKLGEIREVWSIELEPGKRTIAVQADSLASHGTSEPVDVTYEAPEPVQLPALYVLAVGITEYPGDLKLHFAAKDAQAIERVFREKAGPLFRAVDVKLLTDAKATRTEILNGMTWLRKQMTQRDVGVVFFSGHGQRDSEGSLYLLPVDADPENLLTTAVPDELLKKAMAGMPGKVLALLDACHAGAAGGDKRKSPNGLIDDLVRDLVTDDYGVIVMASSTGREFSLENNAERQSNFTLAIVEGLSGAADSNKDGSVYLNELDAYVTDRVKALTKGEQHPVTAKPASIRSFPLSRP